MADWRDSYLTASFRRVIFFTRRATLSGGRRRPEHVYPGRDGAEYEDLGQSERVYRMEGYLLGEDYRDKRDALITAFEDPTPGQLIHPNFPVRKVIVFEYHFEEDQQSGGMVSFNFDYRLVPSGHFGPVLQPSQFPAAREAGSGVKDATGERVEAKLQVDGVPGSALTGAIDGVRALGRKLESFGKVFRGKAAQVAALRDSVTQLIEEAVSLVTTPAQLVATVRDTIETIALAVVSVPDAFEAYKNLFGLTLPRVRGGGPRGGGAGRSSGSIADIANRNTALVERLIQSSALAGWAEAAVSYPWESQDQAIAARDEILAAIDEWELEAADGESISLGALRTVVVDFVPDPSQQLPRLGTYTPRRTETLFHAVHRVYGSLDREAEVLARNHIPNPALIPGGEPLEVLIHA